MRDVHDRKSADFACDLDHFLVVQFARIGRISCEQDFWFLTLGDCAHLVVINFTGLWIFHLVADEPEYFGEIGDRMSVRQVSAVREIHTKDRVAWLE